MAKFLLYDIFIFSDCKMKPALFKDLIDCELLYILYLIMAADDVISNLHHLY